MARTGAVSSLDRLEATETDIVFANSRHLVAATEQASAVRVAVVATAVVAAAATAAVVEVAIGAAVDTAITIGWAGEGRLAGRAGTGILGEVAS